MSPAADTPADNAALQASERRLRAIVQGMPVLMDAFDADGLIVAWNAECERVSGYRADEIVGNPRAMELLYPDPEYRALMFAEAERLRNQVYNDVWELTAKDGSLRTIEWYSVGARMEIPGWLEWSIGIDITERRRLEEALRNATQHEQRRLGHELHDGLGQELTALSMLAATLARGAGARQSGIAPELERLAAIAARAVGSCKSIARGLAPVIEPQQGLPDALRGLTDGLAGQAGGTEFTYTDAASAPLLITLEAANHLYRIAQEALNNVLKHAGARRVQVRLGVDRHHVRLEVSDDGRGFAPQATLADGMGLRTMRDRATAIGARLTVTAAASGGTTVTCEFPNRGAKRGARRRG
jgi:PAS domain S-box-containing protein